MTASQQISDAVASFALKGSFPEDIASLPPVSDTDLTPSIQALSEAKHKLEAEIHVINEETKEEVSSWEKNAKSLQADIVRSKKLASDIVRLSEAPETSGEVVEDAEEKTDFLNREVQYSQQLYGVLKGIQRVTQMFNDVEKAGNERRILDSLRLLEKSWSLLDELGVSRSCRVMRLLDIRSFELKSDVHGVFDRVWKELVQVDVEIGQVTIHDQLGDGSMTLSDAVIGLKAYKEIDERMEQLWRNIDGAIISPRMDKNAASLPKIRASGDILELDGRAESTIQALMTDLKSTFTLLAEKLPQDLMDSLCKFMMVDLIPRLVQKWLTPAIPTSLDNIPDFDQMIDEAGELCTLLGSKGYTHYDELQQWVDDAPNIWLRRCTEKALDTVRVRLGKGIGQSRQVEKVEKHMVSLAEGKELATTGAGATAETNDWGDDWGDAWDEDDGDHGQSPKEEANKSKPHQDQQDSANADEDDGADAWGWGDEEPEKPAEEPKQMEKQNQKAVDAEEDDSVAAWGWGDDDEGEELQASSDPKAPSMEAKKNPQSGATRELVMKETYHISSMPEPVLELIFSLLEDGATLVKDAHRFGHVAATANGLFALPTYVLSLFRAISPHYYAIDGGGNMFLYNDSMYLAEKLGAFSMSWQEREDLTAKAKAMLQLGDDIKTLQGFANRSYSSEMNIQKTVLRDLIGGAQSLTGQDEWEAAIESGTARIRTMAATWDSILARSVWSQAVGSLADALATKLITDVMEMPSIGQDEAYSIAKAITTATELDDLFLPSKLAGTAAPVETELPTTAQYAPSWLRLKYLSEVLQSNLSEVKYLWLESELSLYFTVGEVVDLIEASFENNHRTRETIREIQSNPQPLG